MSTNSFIPKAYQQSQPRGNRAQSANRTKGTQSNMFVALPPPLPVYVLEQPVKYYGKVPEIQKPPVAPKKKLQQKHHSICVSLKLEKQSISCRTLEGDDDISTNGSENEI